MTLVLSARELALLDDALTVVCAPYAHRSSGEWHAAVRLAVEPLLGDEDVTGDVAGNVTGNVTEGMTPARQAGDAVAGDAHAVAIRALLRPAIRASTDLLARRRTVQEQGTYASMLDALPEAAALCAASGALRHENPALRQLLADEPRAALVRSAIAAAARALAADAPAPVDPVPSQEVQGARTRYELRGALVAQARDVASIFLVRRGAARAPTDDELRARFALTPRELEVLRLLATGRSAREVAAALGLSYYTARHHAEHVMAKLGVRTRAAIAAAVATR